MLVNCPRCNHSHEIGGRVAGDRLWCPGCASWLMLGFHRNGQAYFAIVQAPVSYPREKR
jgi:hypothetical protein